MASLFKKWFGGRPDPPAHLVSALQELQKQARERPSLRDSADVLQILLLELFGEPAPEVPPMPMPESAHANLANGVPLLRNESLSFDEAGFHRRALAVCAALKQKDAKLLADALDKKSWAPVPLLREVLAGRPEEVASQAELLGFDAPLLGTVLRLTALPMLASFADATAELRRGIPWDHGFCPTCGSWPLLAESRGLEELRYLRCGLCASAWEGSRFRCVYCGNQDHQSLGYFHVEGEENRFKAATCEECRGYVKVVSALFALSPLQVLIADLATLHLDLVAAERGYFVPSLG